jgi:hypothetical protein
VASRPFIADDLPNLDPAVRNASMQAPICIIQHATRLTRFHLSGLTRPPLEHYSADGGQTLRHRPITLLQAGDKSHEVHMGSAPSRQLQRKNGYVCAGFDEVRMGRTDPRCMADSRTFHNEWDVSAGRSLPEVPDELLSPPFYLEAETIRLFGRRLASPTGFEPVLPP